MLTNNCASTYITQYSNSSVESNDSEVSSSSNTIQVSSYRKQVPTIATGRRSKHLVLVGDEAIKREKRRERNRETARKAKERQLLIEEELHQKLKQLEGEHFNLQNYLTQLHQRKQRLQDEVNNLLSVTIDDLLSNDNDDMLSSEQYSIDLDLFDEAIERILNCDLNTCFSSVINK